MKKFNSARLRFLIMLAVLAVVAAGYFTAGGIGNFCGIGFDTITFLCPLGALLAMIAERTAIPMAVVSVLAVLAVCVVLGKVFCAWACPVHFMARGKRKGKRGASRASGSSAEGDAGQGFVPVSFRGAADESAASLALHAAQAGESAAQAAPPAPDRDKSPGITSRGTIRISILFRMRGPLWQGQGHQDRQPPRHLGGGARVDARVRLPGVLPCLPCRPHIRHSAFGHAAVRVRRHHLDSARFSGHHRDRGFAAAEVVPALLSVGCAAFPVQRVEPDVQAAHRLREVPA